jgi:diaminohydroxyphosphoribosylaminopyrimidine deaminase/5-amino-6-(5-phosphoribosylamino)uracil reductase
MSSGDERWMKRALRLAARGAGRTSPNPMVGAVIVAGGRLVGEGHHKQVGGPHAEVWALRQAGDAARGATIYVTLEPCSHYGRTPPCTDAIIAAGIGKVVAALLDPSPKVNGRGVQLLRDAGIEVEVGVLEQEARELNAAYLKHTTTGLPLVSLKAAMSLDGKIATRTGESKWITGERARKFGHKLRAAHDAVMVGIGTVLTDDPRLTARVGRRLREACAGGVHERRPQAGRSPLRLVVDSAGRTPPGAAVVTADARPPVIAVTASAPQERVDALRQAGAEVWVLPAMGAGFVKPALAGFTNPAPNVGGRVDLAALMRRLGEEQVQSLLIEGGGTLASAALAAGLVDRVYFLLAPLIIGGAAAPTAVDGEGVARLSETWRITNMRVRRIGEDLLITGDVL